MKTELLLDSKRPKSSKGLAETQYVDMICVLNLGFMEIYPMKGRGTSKVMLTLSEMDISPLLYFFIRLLDRMAEKQNVPPLYSNYLGSAPIGLASITTPLGIKFD